MAQFFELLRYDIIAVDGKCLRGSARKSQSIKGDYIVNAYLAKEQVVLGESRVDSKSNEIKKEYKRMCQAIRQHWSVENNLHWKLDVGLNEDACLASRGYAAENLSTLRKLVLKLFENETSMPHGIKMKRLRAANSCRYLRKVIGF